VIYTLEESFHITLEDGQFDQFVRVGDVIDVFKLAIQQAGHLS